MLSEQSHSLFDLLAGAGARGAGTGPRGEITRQGVQRAGPTQNDLGRETESTSFLVNQRSKRG